METDSRHERGYTRHVLHAGALVLVWEKKRVWRGEGETKDRRRCNLGKAGERGQDK
jgi:hypothetical protein